MIAEQRSRACFLAPKPGDSCTRVYRSCAVSCYVILCNKGFPGKNRWVKSGGEPAAAFVRIQIPTTFYSGCRRLYVENKKKNNTYVKENCLAFFNLLFRPNHVTVLARVIQLNIRFRGKTDTVIKCQLSGPPITSGEDSACSVYNKY